MMQLSCRTLGEICDEAKGIIRTGPFGSQLHESDYTEEGIPVVMPKNIVDGRVSIEDIARIHEANVFRLAQHKLHIGDIVYGRRGDIGRRALITAREDGWLCGTGCLRISLGNTVLDPLFLYYYLGQPKVIEWIFNQAIGSTLPNLNTQIIRSIRIAYPNLPTQRKIASILSAYDDLIENNTRRIAILEEMAQSLYREWFVHFRFPGHEKKGMVESALGMIPEGWEVVSYHSLLMHTLGGDWGSEIPNGDENCSVAIIRGTDFDDIRSGGISRIPTRYISERSLTKRKLIAGDIIVENSVNASSRCIGRNLLITQDILDRIGRDTISASFCKVFRLKKPKLAPVVHLNLEYLYDEGRMAFYQHVATNGIGNFQAKRFVESESILLPNSDELQSKMIGLLQGLTSSIYSSKNANLRKTRDLLLPKLIAGEVDVEGLEIAEAEDTGEVERKAVEV